MKTENSSQCCKKQLDWSFSFIFVFMILDSAKKLENHLKGQ